MSDEEYFTLVNYSRDILIFAPLALAIFLIARSRGYFRWERSTAPTQDSVPSVFSVLICFFLYIGLQVFFEVVGVLMTQDASGSVNNQNIANNPLRDWLNLFSLGISLPVLMLYVWFARDQKLRPLWRGYEGASKSKRSVYSHIKSGALSWFLIYPALIVVGHLAAIIVILTLGFDDKEQVAIQFYREAMDNPLLLWVSTGMIGIVVPIVEEILFRLLLQSFFRRAFSAIPSIILASIIFSGFHYSTEQGLQNIELLVTLFTLSCFIGFIYEKQGSVWAPIGLHAIFNLISMFIVIWVS